MNIISIAELQNNPGKILSYIERGERVQINGRNSPIAHIVPYKKKEAKK